MENGLKMLLNKVTCPNMSKKGGNGKKFGPIIEDKILQKRLWRVDFAIK